MTTTTNLGITHVTSAQYQKEVTMNAALDSLDTAVAGRVSINFASDANLTLTAAQALNSIVELTDSGVVLTAARNVIVPTANKQWQFYNGTARVLTIKTSGGTGIALSAGERALLYCNAVNVVRAVQKLAERITSIAYGTTIACDLNTTDIADVTLTDSTATINLSGGTDGQPFIIRLRQDATGSRTVTWGTMVRFSTTTPTPTLTTTASKLDYIAFRYNATDAKYDCVAVNLGY